jgi:hypothetical protein
LIHVNFIAVRLIALARADYSNLLKLVGFGGLYSYHSRQPWLNKNSDGWLNHQLHWARSLAPGIRGTEDEITWMIFPLLFKSPDEKLREQWQHVCFNHNGTTRGVLFTVLGGEIDQTSFMGLDHA